MKMSAAFGTDDFARSALQKTHRKSRGNTYQFHGLSVFSDGADWQAIQDALNPVATRDEFLQGTKNLTAHMA